jgi:hypothetical protein
VQESEDMAAFKEHQAEQEQAAKDKP